MTKVWTFLTTALGSALRVFVGLFLGSLVAYLGGGGKLEALNLETIWTWVGAALAVALPVLIAAINPQDTRFGRTV